MDDEQKRNEKERKESVARAHRDAEMEIRRRADDLHALASAASKPDAIRQAETALKNAKAWLAGLPKK